MGGVGDYAGFMPVFYLVPKSDDALVGFPKLGVPS